MSWYSLYKHDLLCGILRKRNALLLLAFFIPCTLCAHVARQAEVRAGTMDYLTFLFSGIEIMSFEDLLSRFQLPIIWLFTICSALFWNLDYMLDDLTHAGLQIIVRSGKRMNWYLSKCAWNITSCCFYFVGACLVCLLFSLLSGSSLSTTNNAMNLTSIILGIFGDINITKWQKFLLVILCPIVNVMALSMLEMTFCLCMRPIFSYLICISIAVLSIYIPSACIPGNGAMVIRSSLVSSEGIDTILSLVNSIIIIFLCAIIGCALFERINILGSDE